MTDANLEYEGSIAIDSDLMAKVNIKNYEKVLVLNLTNGSRLETYTIPDTPGFNGAAAHLVNPGDRVIIVSYCSLDLKDSDGHKPSIIRLNEQNDIVG